MYLLVQSNGKSTVAKAIYYCRSIKQDILNTVSYTHLKVTEQISVYEADMTYSELFEGQKVKFWPIDEKVQSLSLIHI